MDLKASKKVLEMVAVAIANAHAHDISLVHQIPNLAKGDCLFESIVDNINLRESFNERIDGHSAYHRKKWLSETEDLVFQFSGGGGMSKENFQSEWSLLKKPGNYEYEFGDYILHSIAHCTKKDVLVFNTSLEADYSPISVIEAKLLGGQEANT